MIPTSPRTLLGRLEWVEVLGVLGWVLALSLSARALADTEAVDPPPFESPIELVSPAPDARVDGAAPWVEVRGRAGGAPLFGAEVVVALDRSSAALHASGFDVDGDGVTGRSRAWADERGRFVKPVRTWTTDPEDTLLAAQVELAAAIIHGLGARDDRVGVVTYDVRAKRRAPVGSIESARAALDAIRLVPAPTHTNLARALEVGAGVLREAPLVAGPRRREAILLFSVTPATQPGGRHWAKQHALDVAQGLGEAGIRVWSLGLGEADRPYLAELAEATGGRLLTSEDIRALQSEPVRKTVAPRRLAIENLTLGQAARAVRVFPDGRFDAFVPLEPGANLLSVRATLVDGSETDLRRTVHFEPGDATSEESRRRAARILAELRLRAREIDATARHP